MEGGNQTNIPKIQEQLKHWFQLKKKMNWNNICMRVGTKAELPCYRNLFIPPPQPTVNPLPLVIVADFRLFCGEGDQGGEGRRRRRRRITSKRILISLGFFFSHAGRNRSIPGASIHRLRTESIHRWMALRRLSMGNQPAAIHHPPRPLKSTGADSLSFLCIHTRVCVCRCVSVCQCVRTCHPPGCPGCT